MDAKLFNLAGKTAVITGAAGVLGGSMAAFLASWKVNVVILDRDINRAESGARDIRNQGGSALAGEADVLDRDSLEAVREKVLAEFGAVDILVNCAGGNRKDATASDELSFFDLPAEALQGVTNLNLHGTILPCQVFGRTMADQGSGAIVNISSMTASQPLTRVVAYGAAKAAVDNFTKWLAVYVNQHCSHAIRVNAIAPGFFLTEQNRFLLLDEATNKPTARGQQILDHTPMDRYGQPDDLHGALLWLVSDAARFVTGIVVPVDGGFSAFSGV